MPRLPEDTSGLQPNAVSTAGGTVIVSAMPIHFFFAASMGTVIVPDACRIRYIFNDRWPSGRPLKAKDGSLSGATHFSPDGKTFLAEFSSLGRRPSLLSCFSVVDGRLLGTVTIDDLYAFAFSPSGDHVLCADRKGISIYTAPKLERCYSHERPNEGAAIRLASRPTAAMWRSLSVRYDQRGMRQSLSRNDGQCGIPP